MIMSTCSILNILLKDAPDGSGSGNRILGVYRVNIHRYTQKRLNEETY